MFLSPLFDSFKNQSVARLAGLQLAVLACIISAVCLAAHWVIRHDLSAARRMQRQREIAQLAAVYNSGGWHELKLVRLYTTSVKEEHVLRVTDAYAKHVEEDMSPAVREIDWEHYLPVFVKNGEVLWIDAAVPSTGQHIKILQTPLKDGKYLWVGETEKSIASQAWSATWRLAMLGSIISLIGVVPILWFTRRVYEPLEALRNNADSLRSDKTGRAELKARAAIPELSQLSQSVNTVLNDRVDQITTLSGELNSVNEHLAHELKTPLARIRGDLEDLLDHYGKPDGEDAAVRGMDEIDRASQLVQTILAIRLGDTGSMRLHLELTSPKAMIDELMEMYEPAAEDRNQTLSFTVHQDALVLLDRHRVRQAIVNLLDNALAYTPEGGSVELTQEVDELGYLLRIKDSGPGLTASDMDRIWKRFARGSAASARAPGTGLGLSLVRAVARAHYGEAHANNHEGGGAEFWMRLPLTPYPVDLTAEEGSHL
jgi:signal transduction histidine kinase